MRQRRLALSTGFACLAIPAAAFAVDTTLTQGGFTGLGITPNANLLNWGTAGLAYDRGVPGITADPKGHNFVAGFGLLPNLEVSGRVAANSINTNCFFANCGARDLSLSGKVAIGLDTANRFHAAAGVTDVGGNVTYFRSYYGVLSYDEGPFELNGGLAKRSGAGVNGSKSPLHGVFASGAWQPLPWVRAQVEYTDKNAWAGVRLFAPTQWLPEGWSANVGYNARLTDTNLTPRGWVSAGLNIPLYKVPALPSAAKGSTTELSRGQLPLPAYEARTPAAAASAPAPVQVTPVAPAGSAPGPDDGQLLAVGEALRAKGLEDIWVGRMADGSVAIRANNATYNWNTLDALGAAMGAVGKSLGGARTPYRLILTQRQIPIVAVTGQADCLQQWVQVDAPSCPAGELSTPGTGPIDALHAGATWVVSALQPSWRTVRVSLSPVLRTNVATEVGVLDYSVGARLGLSMPIWAGGSVDLGVQRELARSSDYQPGGVFGPFRIRNGIERAALVQTVRLPLERWFAPGDDVKARRLGLAGVTAQATLGRIGSHFDGVHGAARWEPGDGVHRVTAEAGVFRNQDFGAVTAEPRTSKPLLVSYRYNVTPTRTYLEATAGQFMNNDRGVLLGMRQWFTDLSIFVYYKRTHFDSTGTRSLAGLELSIPIGPRRDMNPQGVQFTGTPRFAHAIETVVGGANFISRGRGVMPPAPSLEAVHNSDRDSLVYFEDNVRRIRDAARAR